MNPLLGILEGFREIWSHKFRSLLTGLGVVLGVASLMSMFAITNGQAIQFRESLEMWGGANRVSLEDRPVPEEQESIKDLSPGRTYADVVALKRVPLVDLVSPQHRLNNGVVEREGRFYRSHWIRGVDEAFLEIENHQVGSGRFFTDVELRNRSRVMVMGQKTKRTLFGNRPDQELLGEQVLFNGVKFSVIGFFEEYDHQYKDRVVVVPFSTMQELFFAANVVNGKDLGPNRKVERIVVRVRDMEVMDEAIEQMRNVLLQTHNGVEDFAFRTRENMFENIEQSVLGVRLSGFIVSGVTLIAAGVGITNIMMASIKERTREIGVRRALGARKADVFVQICLEALVLAVLGGVLGLGAGYALIEVVAQLLDETTIPVIDFWGVLFSFVTAVVIGFLAGIAPAIQASKMNPIEALRFE
ncbi:MAG: ABC transporter permease [Verrucomicrobiota bacterium]